MHGRRRHTEEHKIQLGKSNPAKNAHYLEEVGASRDSRATFELRVFGGVCFAKDWPNVRDCQKGLNDSITRQRRTGTPLTPQSRSVPSKVSERETRQDSGRVGERGGLGLGLLRTNFVAAERGREAFKKARRKRGRGRHGRTNEREILKEEVGKAVPRTDAEKAGALFFPGAVDRSTE